MVLYLNELINGAKLEYGGFRYFKGASNDYTGRHKLFRG